ncbi:Disintegrin and metalloproteinase domain-containing protein 12 [Nibea albiflora]|nr:Disintegrin and metalloproteinase domain-containing protein 12 [Nibea albiflora]
MRGAAVLLPLLLLSSRAVFTAARSLNAPRDGGVLPVDGLTDGTDSLMTDSLRGRHRDYVQVLDSLRGRHRDYVQVLDSLWGRHRDHVQVLDSLRGRHRDHVQVLDSLRGRLRDYFQVLDSLRGRHRDYVQVLDSLRGRLRDYVQVLDSLRGRHRDYVQVLDSLRGRHGDYVQVLDSLRGRHGDYVQVLDSLCGRTATPPPGENSSLHHGGWTEAEPKCSSTVSCDIERIANTVSCDIERIADTVSCDIERIANTVSCDIERIANTVSCDIERIANTVSCDVSSLCSDLLPKPPNVFYYLPNGTGVSVSSDPVCGKKKFENCCDIDVALSGIIVINSTLSFELQPQEEDHHQGEEEGGAGGSGGGGEGGGGSGGGEAEGGVHLLFSISPLEGGGAGGCGVSHTAVPPIHSSTHTHRRRRDILSETKYIELVLVADHQEFLNYQKSNKTIVYRMMDVANQVDWDHLVSVLGVASTVAHELGHNLGMSHDTAERRCSCQNEPRLGGCIMEPSTGFMPGQQFSSCSAADLSDSLLHGGGMCLFNVPQPDRLLGGPRCGNLYVERGEQCDCGLLEECEDPCCNASTCQLVPGAQCSSDGICCHDCKFRVAGSVCREPLGECDLPEFCTGSSPYCPPNVFLQNGEPCEDDASFCYGGVCASMHTQCQTLWGPNSTSGPAVCFSSVNKQGNKFGNCGQLTNGSYIPCGNSDVHCGRIQCQGGRERPLLGTNAEILTTKVHFNHSDLVCRGTFFHLGDDVSDPATVAQGTACGPGKACLNQKCQDVSVFGVDECRRKCNGHGVCNSNKNCHCEVGWAPPDCRYSGHGGSVDSGPARAARGTARRPALCPSSFCVTPVNLSSHLCSESDPVRVALLVTFLFILPLVLLFLALRFPRFRQTLFCLGPNSPFHKARQHNRTPVMERVDGRNGEQVRPLRYHLNPPTDIPLTPPHKERTTSSFRQSVGRLRDYVQVLDSLWGRLRDYSPVLDSLWDVSEDYVQVLDSLWGRLRDYVQVLDSLWGCLRDYVQFLGQSVGRLRDYVQVLDSLWDVSETTSRF